MKKALLLTVFFIFIFSTYIWATPTGLNNIPTADVVGTKTLVWQFYSDIGEDNKPDYFTGFKYGLIDNLEIGLDGRIFPESSQEETITFQIKYRIELNDEISFALGASNLGDRAATGWEDHYLVLTYDFGFLRFHAGGSIKRDNEGAFTGVDKTFQFLDRDFTLRSDLIQTNDSHDITASAGFIYDLGYNFLIESWLSFPTESGKEDILTTKLNYVFNF